MSSPPSDRPDADAPSGGLRSARSGGEEPSLPGVWERSGRNPLVGAFLLVLITGSTYFIVQSIAQGVLVGVAAAVGGRTGTAPLEGPYRSALFAIIILTQTGLLLLGAALLIRRWHTPALLRYLRLRRLPLSGLIVGAVAAVAVLPPAHLAASYLYELFPGLEELAGQSAYLTRADGPRELGFVLATLAVTPAVCEEFLFRAYFQRTLERRMHGGLAVLIAGSLFALFHQQVLTLPSLVLVGVLLSYLAFAYASPYPAVLAHFIYNGLQILLVNGIVSLPGFSAEGGFSLPAAAAGAALLALVVVVTEQARRSRQSTPPATHRTTELELREEEDHSNGNDQA